MTGKISKAYPNYEQHLPLQSAHDTNKWIETVKTMFYFIHKGMEKPAAFDQVTLGWSEMEKKDFNQWLKYYEENNHKKYAAEEKLPKKLAQVSYWQDVNRAGYFVPITPDPASAIDSAKNPATNQNIIEEEKRELIERQRSKILSRLDSAEKLIRSRDGQTFAGKEFEALLHIIYELKKKIQTVNKVSLSNRTYEDMIIREANRLTKQGFREASNFLVKFADAVTPAQPANPAVGAGLPGNLPGDAPGQTPVGNNTPTSVMDVEEPISEGMKGFLEGLDTSNLTSEESLEVNDSEDANLVIEAQQAPAPNAKPDVTPKSEEKTEIEVEDENPSKPNFDDPFKNVTINDVVARLENTSKYYKTREHPRELSIIDMMLDSLGLASLFPSLSEALNKSLEANNYISTRVDDILSKLRGAMASQEFAPEAPKPERPEVAGIKNRLEDDQAQENKRKQVRKEQEAAKLDEENTPEPEVEIQEDLATPSKLTNQMPANEVPPPPAAKAPAPVR